MASEVSISTEMDLLITNMIIFSRLDASFPVKVAKNVKIEKKCQMTEYIDIALSDLVYIYIFFFAIPLLELRVSPFIFLGSLTEGL